MLTVELEQDPVNPYAARLTFAHEDSAAHLLACPRIGFRRHLDGDYFEFEPDVLYVGDPRQDEDTLYEADQYVPVQPRIPLISLVNLSSYYDLPESGSLQVRYSSLHDLDGQPVLLTSAWAEFRFDQV